MAETVIECLDKKAKLKFQEINAVMAETLRDDIIKDSGHPKLKSKCLDLISKLRLESALLNVGKTGKNKNIAQEQAPLKNAKEYDENGIEKLGLDAEGQIKLTHGVEQIQTMIDKGMVKQLGKGKSNYTGNSSQLAQMLVKPPEQQQIAAPMLIGT